MSKQTPIGVGIAGLGRAGWGMHTRELEGRSRRFKVAAACDVLKERRDRAAEHCGCPVYRDVENLIADPAVELVDIATRSPDHVPHTLLALRAGKDVFLEKPMSLTHAGALKIKRAAMKSRGTVYIRHNRRFEPAFQHIREIIAAGLLGDVFEIKLRRNQFARRDDWQTLLNCGGGQLLNWGPHIIDHGLRLLDSPPAALWSDLKKIAAVGDAEDHLKVILRGENGRVVDIEISGGAAIPEPEYVVSGTRGGLSCKGATIHLRYLDPRKKLARRRPKSGTPGRGFGSEDKLVWIEKDVAVKPRTRCQCDHIWDHLYAAIREGAKFPITLDEALQVMDVVSRVKKGTPFEGLRD